MNMCNNGINEILSSCGLYKDLINIVAEYTTGDMSYWRGKYDSVVSEIVFKTKNEYRLNDVEDDCLNKLPAKLMRHIQRGCQAKINCVMQDYNTPVKNLNRTLSVNDMFEKYGIVGMYRVMFDNIVFKIKQKMRVKNSNKFKSSNLDFIFTPKILRHLHNYNHTEYESYFSNNTKPLWDSNATPLWISKVDWGYRDVQINMRMMCKQIRSICEKKHKWIAMEAQSKENNFGIHDYKLANNIKIVNVNNKSIRVHVHTFDGKRIEITKTIGEDKKTKRLYICNPLHKKQRLYADEKFLHYPTTMYTLYKNM